MIRKGITTLMPYNRNHYACLELPATNKKSCTKSNRAYIINIDKDIVKKGTGA
jgi:hypothetical protein